MESLVNLSTPFMASGELLQRRHEYFRENVSSFHVLEIAAEVAGLFGLRPFGDGMELFNLCVSSAWQGDGLGRLLVVQAAVLAEASRCRRLFAFSTKAVGFFLRLGFEVVDTSTLHWRRQETVDPSRGATLLQRTLEARDGVIVEQ